MPRYSEWICECGKLIKYGSDLLKKKHLDSSIHLRLLKKKGNEKEREKEREKVKKIEQPFLEIKKEIDSVPGGPLISLPEEKVEANVYDLTTQMSSMSVSSTSDVSPVESISLDFSSFPIGSHISKKPSLSSTLRDQIEYPHLPVQIMFGRTSTIKISDEEVAKSLDIISTYHLQVFIHTPYILNLCSERSKTSDDYVVKCIRDHLSYGSAFGSKGVVVHVGKSCKMEEKEAIQNMKDNITACIEMASEECPLLLETPAGQGTETLTVLAELFEFVASFQNKRLGVCIDTCHVFACGVLPSEALKLSLSKEEWKSCVKLIHFNDSAKEQSCCVDRHAPIGQGKIPLEDLYLCAEMASKENIPMLNE